MVNPDGHLEDLIPTDSMVVEGTPTEDYEARYGLWVKREDLSCPPPGPPFSKARGVWSHLLDREEETIGVLDTVHSQAGHAVARACSMLGKTCLNYYPEYKHEKGVIREPQLRSSNLGAELVPLPAGRSCILYHGARKHLRSVTSGTGYLMPNALKLRESVEETAKEVGSLPEEGFDYVIVPCSSATIAAGVIKGFLLGASFGYSLPRFILHLGYSRSSEEVLRYVFRESTGGNEITPNFRRWTEIVDEKYAYKDVAKEGETPTWPCNVYYDLKAFRWWLRVGSSPRFLGKKVLFWNIG